MPHRRRKEPGRLRPRYRRRDGERTGDFERGEWGVIRSSKYLSSSRCASHQAEDCRAVVTFCQLSKARTIRRASVIVDLLPMRCIILKYLDTSSIADHVIVNGYTPSKCGFAAGRTEINQKIVEKGKR